MDMFKTSAADVQPQITKGDRIICSASDDKGMLKQIQDTHVPDGCKINIRPLLHIVEDIFNCATTSDDSLVAPGTLAHSGTLEERTSLSDVLDLNLFLIDQISCAISCKNNEFGEAHPTAISILKLLSYFTWDAKLVMALAAFAVNYGEFWLIAKIHTSNQLAKDLALLRRLPEFLQHSKNLKNCFDSIATLILSMLDITKYIVEIYELPSQYVAPDIPEMSSAINHIPLTVYWTIRSILACASEISSLAHVECEHTLSATKTWELSGLTQRLDNMLSSQRMLMAKCQRHIGERKYAEARNNLKHLFETDHIDNMKILQPLLNQNNDPLPLYDVANKRRVGIDVLRRKNVFLLISDLDIMQEEVSILEQVYCESRQHQLKLESQYEMVWVPIIDPAAPWTESEHKQFEILQARMTWHTLHHPSLMDQARVDFIKGDWLFEKKPILVVLDPQGQIACQNAIHMIWIWGSLAFPFTSEREQALWSEQSWKLELLVGGTDELIPNWIADERYICLYGGEDIEWIRKLTSTTRSIAQAAGINLEMAYVGKSKPRERAGGIISTIRYEKLSHTLADFTAVRFFWARIESMWHSKSQLDRTIENDQVMQEITTLRVFDGSEECWALLSRGSAEMTRARGNIFLSGFAGYNEYWKEHVPSKGLVPALHDHLMRLQQRETPHHCSRLLVPSASGKIPERIVCSECGRPLERYIMYRCCDE